MGFTVAGPEKEIRNKYAHCAPLCSCHSAIPRISSCTLVSFS